MSGQTALLQALEQATLVEPGPSVCVWAESGGVVREEVGYMEVEGGCVGQGEVIAPARKKPKRNDHPPSLPVTLSVWEIAGNSSSASLATCNSTSRQTACARRRQTQGKAPPPPLAVDPRVREVAETPFRQHQSHHSSPEGPYTEMSPGSLTVREMPCERNIASIDKPSTSSLVMDESGEAPRVDQTTVSDLLTGLGDARTESEVILAEDTPLQDDLPLPEVMTHRPRPLPTIAETQLPFGTPEESPEDAVVPEGGRDSGAQEAGTTKATPPNNAASQTILIKPEAHPTEGQSQAGHTCLSAGATPLLGQSGGQMRTIAETQLAHTPTQPPTTPDIVALPSAAADGVCPTGTVSPERDADSTVSLSPPSLGRGLPQPQPPSSSLFSPSSHLPPTHRPLSHGQNAPGYGSGNDTTPELVCTEHDQGTPAAPKNSKSPEGVQPKPLPFPPPRQLPNMDVTPSLSRLISPCIPLQNIYSSTITMATSSGNERTVIPDTFAASRVEPSATPTLVQSGHTPVPSSQKTPFMVSLPSRDSALSGLHTFHALRAATTQETPLPPSRRSMDKGPTPPHPPHDSAQPPTPVTPSGLGPEMAASRRQPASPPTDGLTAGSMTVIPDSVVLPDSGPSGAIALSPSGLAGVEKGGCGSVGVVSSVPSPPHTMGQSVGSCAYTQTGGYSQWDGE